MELKLFGVDEFKDNLAVFYIDRGEDLNAYIWVRKNGGIRITDIYGVASYCNHSVSPFYVGDDVPDGFIEEAYGMIESLPDDKRKELIDQFNVRDKRLQENEEEYDERKKYEESYMRARQQEIDSGDGVLWLM